MHSQPKRTYPLDDRRERTADCSQLRGHQIHLLCRHPFRTGPVKPQHKRRDSGPRDKLLQDLPDRHLGIQDLPVGPDYAYIHVAHGDKIPDCAALSGLHGSAPFGGDLLGALLGIGPVQHVPLGLIGNREPHVSRPFPINAYAVINLKQDVRQKGHAAEHGNPVGGIRFGVIWRKQQKGLVGQLPQHPAFIVSA